MLQHPSKSLDSRDPEPQRISDDAIDVDLFQRDPERVHHLAETAAVTGHGKSIQKCALDISDGHARFADPHVSYAEESFGGGLNEPVPRAVRDVYARGAGMPLTAVAGNRSPTGREDEHLPRRLIGEPVVVHRRPMRNSGRVDESHGDFEFMRVRDARHRRGQGVQSPSHGHDPTVSAQVMKSLTQIRFLQTDTRGYLFGAVGREKSVAFVGELPDQIDSDQRLLRLGAERWFFEVRFHRAVLMTVFTNIRC